MKRVFEWVQDVDVKLTNWMAEYGITLLRISVGVVFLWFGFIKFFPGLSPAQDLAARTIETMTLGLITESIAIPVLAAWETAIGIGLITKRFMRITLFLLFTQMIGTVMPIFFFPSETFNQFPFSPTLEGQYILKNVVLVSAGFVIGATVRGGAVIADPDATEQAREVLASKFNNQTEKQTSQRRQRQMFAGKRSAQSS